MGEYGSHDHMSTDKRTMSMRGSRVPGDRPWNTKWVVVLLGINFTGGVRGVAEGPFASHPPLLVSLSQRSRAYDPTPLTEYLIHASGGERCFGRLRQNCAREIHIGNDLLCTDRAVRATSTVRMVHDCGARRDTVPHSQL